MDNPVSLRDKKIILGITGCIAAYKSAELARSLMKLGADVRCVMTSSAKEFITPLTLRTLTGNPCFTEMFDPSVPSLPMPHISLSDSADLLVIAPATANIIGKAAAGISDDLLSTLILSCECQKLFAPAMNDKMWRNKAVKDNTTRIKQLGIKTVGPDRGDLACGREGEGRMAAVSDIVKEIVSLIGIHQDLAGKKVLVTAGGTREAIDPVRFIGNRSSGRMGYAAAKEAQRRGADVTLISANVELPDPEGIDNIKVLSAKDMLKAVENSFKDADILVMAAAPADYTPVKTSSEKIKKSDASLSMPLAPTQDILLSLSKNKGKKVIVGFSVESSDLLKNAKAKLASKGLDMIVANGTDAFEGASSTAVLISKSGKTTKLPRQSKELTAKALFDELLKV